MDSAIIINILQFNENIEFKFIKSINLPKIIKIEAIAWGKKYLIDASVLVLLILTRIRGIILIKLISKPNHLVNQELDETATTVPVVKKKKNNIW